MTEQMNAEERVQAIQESFPELGNGLLRLSILQHLTAHGESERAKALREAADLVRGPKPTQAKNRVLAQAIEAMLEEE